MCDPGVERGPEEPAPDDSDACVDRRVIAELRALSGDDPGFLNELIEEFSRAFPEESRALADAIANADPRLAGQMAHKLKGSCAALGAIHLTSLCNTIEQQAREQRLDGLQPLLAEMDDEFHRVRRALDQERQRCEKPAAPAAVG